MAPAVVAHPEARPIKEQSYGHHQCSLPALCRIEDDLYLTPISEHQDISDGITAGKHTAEVDVFDFGYGLVADGVKVASFAEGRIGYRGWARRNGRLGEVHGLDDRYDHDVEELMA